MGRSVCSAVCRRCSSRCATAAGAGHQCQAALAPTLRGALWLAMAAPGTCCPDIAGMRNELAALPVSVLALPAREAARIEGFGVRRLGDLFRLPRWLSWRLGAAFTADLARALGELPDPQPRFVFPQRFRDRLELNARVEGMPGACFLPPGACCVCPVRLAGGTRLWPAGLRTLELEQAGWRRAEKSGAEAGGGPRPGEPLRVELGFSELTRDPDRIGRTDAARAALAHIRLDAPVHALSLHADAPPHLPGVMAACSANVRQKAASPCWSSACRRAWGERAGVSVDVVPASAGVCLADAGARPAVGESRRPCNSHRGTFRRSSCRRA